MSTRGKNQVKVNSSPESSHAAAKDRILPVHSARQTGLSGAPPIVHEVLASPGQPLDPDTRLVTESRFGHDFSQVRIHRDGQAARSAEAIGARAYTVGQEVVLGRDPSSAGEKGAEKLLAHELVHTLQQREAGPSKGSLPVADTSSPAGQVAEAEADRMATDFITGEPSGNLRTTQVGLMVQCDRVQIRSPVFEEVVTQVSEAEASVVGRPLTDDETTLAQEVFGNSIDYPRVRLIYTDLLEYRTVGNTIRVPENFSITDPDMAQILIHELTHVWQYQHTGTSYISVSLTSQIVATLQTGSRNPAYDYELTPESRFFDFLPEQQGLIVENYYAMQRDQNIPQEQQQWFRSNHMDGQGNFYRLTWEQRQEEINQELPLHEPLIQQMRVAVPRSEVDLFNSRMMDLMALPTEGLPEELQPTPVRPLVEVRFPGLTELFSR